MQISLWRWGARRPAPSRFLHPLGAQYNSGNCEAIGLLVAALDDWELSHFEDASALFRDFVASDPKPPYDWIAQYKPLAQKYVADYDAYKKITAEIQSADTAQKQTDVLEDLRVFKSNIHIPGKLASDLLQTETELQNKVAARQAEEQRVAAAGCIEARAGKPRLSKSPPQNSRPAFVSINLKRDWLQSRIRRFPIPTSAAKKLHC